jgi:hypothetical protein
MVVEVVKRGEKFERVNVVGALRNEEYYAIECYQHTTVSGFFESWFKDCLLAEIPKGCTIILDNARFHRKEVLCTLATGKAGLLFLPLLRLPTRRLRNLGLT